MSENGFSEEIQKILQEDLEVHVRQGPGANYSYFKGEDVIKQLNKAFGHCWSSEVISSEEVHGQILIQASVSVFVEGDIVVHHGFASSSIARSRKDNNVIDIGNSYKAAYTGAIKKAAEQFGIGLGAVNTTSAPSAPVTKAPAPSKVYSNPTPTEGHQSFSQPPKKEKPVPTSRPSLKPAGVLKPRLNGAPAPTTKPMVAAAVRAAPENMSKPTPPGIKLGYDVQEEEMSGLLSDAQKGAIQKLTDKKGITVSSAIEKALKVSDKTLDTLTKAEAVLVIRYSNTARAGA